MLQGDNDSPSKATARTGVPPTLSEIRRWPATVSVRTAATAFGISHSHAYELINRGQFPATVIRLGPRRRVVVTASILHALSGETDPTAHSA